MAIEFSAEVAEAWTTAYGTLSTFMIEQAYGRAQARQIGRSAMEWPPHAHIAF